MPKTRSKRSKMVGVAFGVVGLVVVLGLVAGACFGAPGYQGPTGGNFNGQQFVNQIPQPSKGMGAYLSMRLEESRDAWPDWIEAKPTQKPEARVKQGEIRVTFINHATLLLQIDGVNILTDPVWSDRVGPLSWAGPKRVREPGLALDALPYIDAIAISHNHYDHLDIPTLQELYTRFEPKIFAGLGTGALLEEHGIPSSEDMAWWDTLKLPGDGVRITAVPAQHWSGRGLNDQKNTLWMGFVFEGSAGPVYFAGDTGWGPHFEQIGKRFSGIRLALLPIGAYKPQWFMAPYHISPQEAVDAYTVLKAKYSVPIHYGTFQLGMEGFDDPLNDLAVALDKAGIKPTLFRSLEFGEAWTLPTENR